jgi:hypothetical protein
MKAKGRIPKTKAEALQDHADRLAAQQAKQLERMQKNRENIERQRVLDEERKDKISRKRQMQDMADFKEEQNEQKRRKVAEDAELAMNSEQHRDVRHDPGAGPGDLQRADQHMTVVNEKENRPPGNRGKLLSTPSPNKRQQKSDQKTPTADVRQQLAATTLAHPAVSQNGGRTEVVM